MSKQIKDSTIAHKEALKVNQAMLSVEASISQEKASQLVSQNSITDSVSKKLQDEVRTSSELSKQATYSSGIAANKITLELLAKKQLNTEQLLLTIDNAKTAAAVAHVDSRNRIKLAGNDEYQTALLSAKLDEQKATNEEALIDFANKKILLAKNLLDPNKKLLDIAERQQSKQQELDQGMEKYLGAWKDFKAIAQDPKIATGLFMLAAVDEAQKFAETIAAASADIGMSRTQGYELADSMAMANVKGLLYGVSAKQNADAMAGLVDSAGTLKGITSDNILGVSNIARELGLAEKDAGKLVGRMMLVEGHTFEASKETLKTVENLARGAKLPIGKVTQDLADNMELTSKFGNISVAELGKMAVEAGKLGTTLAQMNSLGDSLMDIDTARTKAMELSMLLGKQINVDKAQQLIYDGDIEGGYKEMLNQVGGISAFNEMDYYQKKQTADLMGLTTGELEKQLNKAAGLTETGEAQASGWAAIGEATARHGKSLMDNMQTIAATANMFSLLKTSKIGGYAIDAAHWVKEKAHMLWKKVFGGSAGGDTAGPLKADGTPDMRFAANKVKDSVTDKVKDVVKDKAEGVVDSGKDKVQDMISDKAKDSIDGGDKLGKGKAGGIGAKLKDLAKGLKAMGKGTFKGIAALALAGPALLLALPSIPFLLFMGMVPLAMLATNFGFLGKGLGALGKGFSSILKGLLILGLLGIAMIPAAFAFGLLEGVDAASMLAFSLSLGILGLAAAGLGMIFPMVLLGSLALAVLGVAIIPAALAMGMLGSVDPSAMIGFALGLGLMGVAVAGIGYLLPFVLMGIIGLAALAMVMPLYTNSLSQIPGDLNMMDFAAGTLALGLAGIVLIPGALGFVIMAGAIALFAGSLLLLLPLLPVMQALGSFGGGSVGGNDTSSGSKKEKDDDGGALGKKLDRLISLVEAGGDVIMDGKKVGKVIQLASGLGGS